jgi:hypothetical protein
MCNLMGWSVERCITIAKIVRFLSASFAVIAAGDALSQSPPMSFQFTAQEIETAKVNESGKRNDQSSSDCWSAPSRPFDQSTVTTKVEKQEDADVVRCDPSFFNYVEIIPGTGIVAPNKVCLNSFVVSVGGVVHYGKRGRLQCSVSGQYIDYASTDSETKTVEDRANLAARSPNLGGDASVEMPTIPLTLNLEQKNRSLVTISLPLRTLQYQIDKSVADLTNSGLPAGFSVKIQGSRFDGYVPGSLAMGYYVDVDVSGPIGVRCEITSRFAIPAASPETVHVQDLGVTTNCRTGSLIGQLANLPKIIGDKVREAVSSSMGKPLLSGGSYADWSRDDPELATFLKPTLVQGSYCPWHAEPGLCLRIGWRDPLAISSRGSKLLAAAPLPAGPADRVAATANRDKFRSYALQHNMWKTTSGISFPSGLVDGAPEDGDMALFGGILCRAGEPEGCRLLRDAYTPDGRFWRSPRRVQEAETKDHATFSGDQLKGVLQYFVATADAPRLRAFLKYIRSQPTQVPGPDLVLESGYSVCPNFGPNFTCMVGDDAWKALRLLATKNGMESELPADLPNIESRYGFNYDALVWSAMLVNASYRLHLVANTIWILQSLGETDARLGQAAAILAARQPQNPFFVYLHLGADRRVQDLADKLCVAPETRSDFSDWAWQRADAKEAWKNSMVWDCVFIYRLLAGDGQIN